MQTVLLSMLETIGNQSGYMGVATPATIPSENPDGRPFYLAVEAGDYSAFGTDYVSMEEGLGVFSYEVTDGTGEWLYADLFQSIEAGLSTKQDALTQGEGISISNDVISVSVNRLKGLTVGEHGLEVAADAEIDISSTNPISNAAVADMLRGLTAWIDEKQDKITAGDGVSLDDNELTIVAGNGISVEGGVLHADMGEVAEGESKPVSGDSVHGYVESKKGTDIAPLEGGVVPYAYLPDDVVYEGEGTVIDDPVLQNLFDRTIAMANEVIEQAQRAIVNMESLRNNVVTAMQRANTAAANALSASVNAQDAANSANSAAGKAQAAITSCYTAVQNAQAVTQQMQQGINTLNNVIAQAREVMRIMNDATDDTRSVTSTCLQAIEDANDAAQNANTATVNSARQTTLCADATALAVARIAELETYEDRLSDLENNAVYVGGEGTIVTL